MLSPLVVNHIKRNAKKNNIKLPDEYKFVLLKWTKKYSISEKIIFSWLFDAGSKVLNASATIPGIVLVNAEWASRLVLNAGDKEMETAFELTIGHELTHHENDYFFLDPFTKDEKFIYWINEIHADFGGIQKMFAGDVSQGEIAMRYKQRNRTTKDKDTYTHPSWEKRISFIKEHNFDEKLIRVVAQMTGCENEHLIDRVCRHFERML